MKVLWSYRLGSVDVGKVNRNVGPPLVVVYQGPKIISTGKKTVHRPRYPEPP